MHDITTTEGRKVARSGLWSIPPLPLAEVDQLRALDGLDIAEKALRAVAVLEYLEWEPYSSPSSGEWFRWDSTAKGYLRRARAEWDTWKEKR